MENTQKRFWLSFCDVKKPHGPHQFLGVIVVKAVDTKHALVKTWNLNINPGGEMALYEIPDDLEIKPHLFDRLLSKQDLVAEGFAPAA